MQPPMQPYQGTEFARALPPPGETITDLEKLAHTMGRVAFLAHQVGLPHIGYGMYGYQQVTLKCIEWQNEFDDWPKISRTMPEFASLIFNPLAWHVLGKPDDTGVWHALFYNKRARLAHPSIAMGDFLTLHVRADLPEALLITRTESKHEKDYKGKVNDILHATALQIMPQYANLRPSARFLGMGRLGLKLALDDLRIGRDEAWDCFEALRDALPAEQAAIRAARDQRAVSSLWSSRSGADWIVRAATRSAEFALP